MTPVPPFLRTLAPLLRSLERKLREWVDARHRYPVSLVARSELEGIADDLKRKSESLDVDQPLLIIMLMGGTGVGKSSLMNALAGAPVAQASFTRPTTRDPVVYFHQSVKPDKLDPALRLCRLSQHDREELRDKVIVDTPDVDSNDLANREKLIELLPVADVVLYVGSQEKYHDQIGWELFKAERQRRAFAFVMNKWDRCLDTGAAGLRPDEDWLRDLHAEGFQNPKLFRTTAQAWVDAAKIGPNALPENLPPGEQFRELKDWLELGLTRLEIDAVKARGVGQLLTQTQQSIKNIRPLDLTVPAQKVRAAWEKVLTAEAEAQGEVLVSSLEPFQNEVEQHFSQRGHQRFRGLMAGYLRLTNKLRYVGSSLRDRIPFAGKTPGGKSETPGDWDINSFVRSCARTASDRVLTQRMTALTSRLLVETDQHGFPLSTLNDRTTDTAKLDWEDRITRAVVDSLAEVEQEVTRPTGSRRILRDIVGFMGNFVPEMVLISTIAVLLWRFFVSGLTPEFFHVLLPVYVTLGSLVVMHVLILFTLPVRWSAIRNEFHHRLQTKLGEEFERTYLPIPQETADAIAAERKTVDELLAQTDEVSAWLAEREQAASIGELYGRQAEG
jgi:50S ribosome-binding GTPase